MNKQMIAALSAITVSFAGTATAATIAFDIGPLGLLDGDGGLDQSTLSDGNVWNIFGRVGGGVDLGGVQDTNGNETAITMRAAGVSGRDGNSTLNAGWGGTVPQTVVDSWYFRDGVGTMSFVLKGFDPGSAWDIDVIDSFKTGTGANTIDIQVNGLFADGSVGPSATTDGDGWRRREDGWDNDAVLSFDGFTADQNGEFVITLSGGNPTIQGLVLTAVPEPSSSALVGIGGLALILRRRK
ncbi:PEP-CTERM sorting domain-containing protein [Oceaniferula marina]|uniref:PEP-CTERM sorting domain-containing protein n=1 Tax=Oceaniferula marina TaxID=2748318 RepID=UPI001D04AF4B|nr:PEP-CTERM sorting domain-containing protein [Oceaniferula marina]